MDSLSRHDPPLVTANPPPASPAGGPVATHASDSTTAPPSGDKEKKKRKKGQESAKGKVRAAAQKQRDKKARLSFAVARRERLGPFMIIGTLPYRGGSAAYEAADRLKNPDSYEDQDPPAGCDHLSDYDPAEGYGSDDFFDGGD